jgi:signal transduction histidine kinase
MQEGGISRFGSAPASVVEERPVDVDERTVDVGLLLRRIEELQAEKEALERFASVAAHELMEPLVMAEAHATLIAESLGHQLEGEVREELDRLMRGTSRMRLIVETLLHDARSSSRPLERVPVDLSQVAAESLELLRHEARVQGATIEVEPLPVVNGDPVLLAGVIKNLLLNAIRYGPRSGGTVALCARRVPGAWHIVVTSQGRTVPREERRRIFDPFRRGSRERRAAGTGLGLAICRSIVERHGGKIGVQPLRPRGNRFYFTIPDRVPRSSVSRPALGVAGSARRPPAAS